ncbi:MAG: glucan biosynthesis protein [Opitutaceae bacterium]
MKLLRLVLLAALPVLASAETERTQVDFDFIRRLAQERAAAPHVEHNDPPRALADLSPAEIERIRFRPEQALWAAEGLPFRLQFFHPSAGWPPVALHEFSATHVQEIPFVGSLFDYGDLRPGRLPASLGYGGFRVHSPLNRAEHFDELLVFPGGGASFRALGAGQNFGLSARALAIDAGPLAVEEHPRFTKFWIGRPRVGANSLTIYALLESPRAVGAYEFVVVPAASTVVDVHAVVIFRAAVAQPGFAPLSGMFWYGENSDRPPGEPRPEVHEADGLAVLSGDGAAFWRPLQNPPGPFASGIGVGTLRGFGLLQRDRVFEHYGDLDADYHRRPSVWVEPIGDWGPGHVQLVENPAHGPQESNIVTFWAPDHPPAPGEPIELRYRLHWTEGEPAALAHAPVVATHVGSLADRPLGRLFWIDFASPSLARLDDGALDAEIGLGPGAKVLRQSVRKNPLDASWRVALETEADTAGRAVEIRCRLRQGYAPVSETWIYSWLP